MATVDIAIKADHATGAYLVRWTRTHELISLEPGEYFERCLRGWQLKGATVGFFSADRLELCPVCGVKHAGRNRYGDLHAGIYPCRDCWNVLGQGTKCHDCGRQAGGRDLCLECSWAWEAERENAERMGYYN